MKKIDQKIDELFKNACGDEPIELLEIQILEFLEREGKNEWFYPILKLEKRFIKTASKREFLNFRESCYQMEKHNWISSIGKKDMSYRITPLGIQFLANWKQVRMNRKMLLIAFAAFMISAIAFFITALMNLYSFYEGRASQKEQIELLQEISNKLDTVSSSSLVEDPMREAIPQKR